jgi:mercuric reductase
MPRELEMIRIYASIYTNIRIYAAAGGITEAHAHEQGRPVRSNVLPLEAVPRAQVNHEIAGLIKLVADAESGRILRVHMAYGGRERGRCDLRWLTWPRV